MEGCDQLTALAGSHNVAVDNSQDLGRSLHLSIYGARMKVMGMSPTEANGASVEKLPSCRP